MAVITTSRSTILTTIKYVNTSLQNSKSFYYPPLLLELPVGIISLLSILLNAVVLLVVRHLYKRTGTPFLYSISLLVVIEICLCIVRFVHAILCIGAILSNTITLADSWFDMPDIVFWAITAVFQFVRNWWLVCITFYRMLMVCFPLRNFLLMHKTLINRFFIATWIFSISLPSCIVPQFISGHTIDFSDDSSGIVISLFALSNASPTFFVLILSGCIVVRLLGCGTEYSLVQKHGNDKDNNRRATRTVLLIAMCFLIFQIPIFITSIIFMTSARKNKLGNILYVSLNLIYLDTLSNCVVLIASNETFRTLFKAYICCDDPTKAYNERHPSKKYSSRDTKSSSLKSSSGPNKYEQVEMNEVGVQPLKDIDI